MNFLIGILMAARSLTVFIGLAEQDNTFVQFAEPKLIISEQQIKVNISLKNGYNSELRDLAETGTQINLYTYFEFIGKKSGLVKKSVVESRLYYNIITKEFIVKKSIEKDSSRFAILDSAIIKAEKFNNVFVASLDSINSSEEYYMKIYALLGETNIEALKNSSVDLMYYWDFKRPSVKTSYIGGSEFFGGSKKP